MGKCKDARERGQEDLRQGARGLAGSRGQGPRRKNEGAGARSKVYEEGGRD